MYMTDISGFPTGMEDKQSTLWLQSIKLIWIINMHLHAPQMVQSLL